jgi:hypothetical protein
MSVSLHGLTPNQVKLLDKLWSIDTQEEVSAWFAGLDNDTFREAVVLQQMLLDAMLEESAEDNVLMARNMLRDIGVKC